MRVVRCRSTRAAPPISTPSRRHTCIERRELAIAIHTRSGNLALSAGNTLTAHAVSLTADGGAGNALDTANGNVNVSGTIDASGKAGGAIALYGRSGVDVEGTLLARGSDSKQRGGRVDIGTSGVFDPSVADPYNATYGYENIDPSRAGLIRSARTR